MRSVQSDKKENATRRQRLVLLPLPQI